MLTQLLNAGPSGSYGLEIIAEAKVGAGTAYPMLTRLEELGWLESQWEDIDPTAAGRPARRYYQLTATGRIEATELLSRGKSVDARLSQA